MNETEARSALRALRAAPYGVTRNANAEQLTRRIEAEGPASCLAEALLDLVEGYVFSDEGHKAIAAIARALRLNCYAVRVARRKSYAKSPTSWPRFPSRAPA